MEISDIKNDLLPFFKKYKNRLVFAYLFGSATRKADFPPNDIDIAVFVRSEENRSYSELKLSLHADISRALKKKKIDLVILNSTTNVMLLDEIVRKGMLLIDQDRDIREEFELEVLHQSIDFKEQRFMVMGV